MIFICYSFIGRQPETERHGLENYFFRLQFLSHAHQDYCSFQGFGRLTHRVGLNFHNINKYVFFFQAFVGIGNSPGQFPITTHISKHILPKANSIKYDRKCINCLPWYDTLLGFHIASMTTALLEGRT